MMEYDEELMHSIIAELDEPLSLEHIGVKGKSGRYPWGSGDRPYQRLEGTSQMPSKTARHAYDKKRKALAKQAEKAQAKQKKAEIKTAKEQARKEEAARKQQEKEQKEKNEALTDPTKLDSARKKYDFSEEEINKALQNFEWDKKIETYSIEKMQRAQKKMDTILGYGKKAVDFYNFTAGVINSVDSESKLPILKLDKDNREAIAKRKKDEKTEKEQSRVRQAQAKKTEAEARKAEAEANQAETKATLDAFNANQQMRKKKKS